MADLDTDEIEYAILLEDYNSFPESTHAARLHWITSRGLDYKPAVLNGTRVVPQTTGAV